MRVRKEEAKKKIEEAGGSWRIFLEWAAIQMKVRYVTDMTEIDEEIIKKFIDKWT